MYRRPVPTTRELSLLILFLGRDLPVSEVVVSKRSPQVRGDWENRPV